jgi:hypothetical protein
VAASGTTSRPKTGATRHLEPPIYSIGGKGGGCSQIVWQVYTARGTLPRWQARWQQNVRAQSSPAFFGNRPECDVAIAASSSPHRVRALAGAGWLLLCICSLGGAGLRPGWIAIGSHAYCGCVSDFISVRWKTSAASVRLRDAKIRSRIADDGSNRSAFGAQPFADFEALPGGSVTVCEGWACQAYS